MIKLHARLKERWDDEPFVAKIVSSPREAMADPLRHICFDGKESPAAPLATKARLRYGGAPGHAGSSARRIDLPDSLSYLEPGDIVCVNPRAGEMIVMYRRASAHNAIFATAQCNSNCVMCSQPPQAQDDSFLVDRWLEAIPLMDPQTLELGITGGEPTLLGGRFLDLVRACAMHLPSTSLHVLSNGRLFCYLSLCHALADIGHPDLMAGIPLYSDIPWRHDYVVQAEGAFDQTIRGIMNLKRCGMKVEIRVVLHRQTVDRLPQLARYIAHNLPMVDHVALMGLEIMGYVRMNLDALWIDPLDYQRQISDAIHLLDQSGLCVSIYNHPLCLLDRALWPFARKSISDWKSEYLDECECCVARSECGGLFTSGLLKHSDHIRPLTSEDLPLHASAACDVN